MKRTLILLIGAMLLFARPSDAQPASYPATEASCQLLGKSRPLSELPAYQPTHNSKKKSRRVVPKGVPNFTENHPMPSPFADQALPKGLDPLLNWSTNRNNTLEVIPEVVFDGLDETRTAGVQPPDPNGDVSNEHYIQVANTVNGGTHMVVYDLEGNQVFELENLNALWTEFSATGLGDPIILWDHAAGRWFLTEFRDFSTTAVLVAVSETSDPTGSWYVYQFQTPEFPDYPKYGVWHNAYFLTTNEGGSENIPIYAFDRQAMLNGEEAAIQAFGIPKIEDPSAFQVATPIDWDGQTTPPAGSPGYAVRMYDDAWGGGQDKVELWEINLDWENADNSSLVGPIDLPTAPFESQLCQFGIFDCLPHPSGQLVSALQHVIMHRVPYMNFGSHESIVLQFAVDVNGEDRAGIRWMELRKNDGGTWSLYQEGTHAPDDPHNRFMGSIGMDRNGNILLAYTLGGPEKEFSLAFTGRLANDPLGEMTVEEYEFATGLSSGITQRWGDYASMSIHPGNGTDFWFTGQYMQTNQWSTKIMMARVNRDSNDVGPQAIITPQNSGYLTDTETLEVGVRNYGFKPQSNIEVSFSVNGSPTVTETITETIPPDGVYQHTFTPTVDMETIGNYDFVIHTSLASDTTFFNDTLRRTVRQLPRNDVAIIGIDGFSPVICDSTQLVEIAFRNAGVDTLYSAVITYQLNDDAPEEFEWEGEMAPGEINFISVLAGPFQEGINTFTASASMPNGLPDEGLGDDSRTETFEVVYNATEVTLNILTDSYPYETTWEIKNEGGEVLYEGGDYTEEGALFQHPLCLPEACYTLTIYDSFGDGMIGPPPGSVEVVNEDGIILTYLDGSDNFGSEIDLEFCSDFECMLELSAETQPESAPGANDGSIIFNPDNGIPNFSYSINGGASFQSSSVFTGLPGGTYELIVQDGSNCVDTLIVELLTCMLDIGAEVLDANEGVANGSITINVDGGVGPYTYSLNGGSFQDSNVFENLPAGDYIVTINDQQGCDIDFPVTVDMIVDTQEPRILGYTVRLFPNPTEGFVRIEIDGLEGNQQLPIKVYDSSGKVVRHYQLSDFGGTKRGVLSLYDLPDGSYFVRFVDERLPHLYTVVKQ